MQLDLQITPLGMENNTPAPDKLLIVDDEPALRLLLSEFLKNKFSVVALKNGAECISHLQTQRIPKVVIVDLEMPVMSGMEVIHTVRNNEKWNPIIIIVLSSRESSKDRISCLRAGADDYIVKPFNPEELDARINAIMRRTALVTGNIK